ncbi:MAG: hypothetical protein AB1469_04395 [Pseudomonadota bacterium]
MKPSYYKKTIVAAVLLLGGQAAGAEQNSFSMTTGFDYSSGKYGGTTSTDILYIPVIGKYETGRTTLKLTVPYISIKSAGGVVGGGDGRVVIGPGSGARRTESGLGDVVAAATYMVLEGGASAPLVDVTGKIKFATADEDKGLGTGENDYAVQADVYKSYGRFTPFGTLGYKWLGDTAATDFKNVFYGTLGGAYKINAQTSSGLIWDLREASTGGSSPQNEATVYVSHKFDSKTKVQGYAVKGFTDGSPDWGAGAMVTFGF